VSVDAVTDLRLLRLAAEDNVLIVVATIPAAERFDVEGQAVEASAVLPIGFKVAATDLEEGTIAVRYGVPIGKMTSAVRRGELIHSHNLASMYMRSHRRGEA
jgi:hypothetical protein